ncbi:MAG: proteasome-type protease [Pseudomonadota bacterium]
MTYCVGLMLDAGLVMLSDTRTNAGLDNISTYRKMFTFEQPGERVIVVMTAGSLSVTQTTLARLQEAIDDPENIVDDVMQAPSMLAAARIVGNMLAEVAADLHETMDRMKQSVTASMIVAGQRRGGNMRTFLIYPEGNFIEATDDTPFLQIGEHKYGKPLLDRVVTPAMGLEDAQKAALLSMDSTLRSNLSVGMPLDLAVIEKDTYRIGLRRRIEREDAEFAAMSRAWSDSLRNAFTKIVLSRSA